jgi:putative pyruvate formate lyase activating enzyme
MAAFRPTYIETYEKGILQAKIEKACEIMDSCRLCPHLCGINRLKTKDGVCKTGKHARVSSYAPHFGEEGPLVGKFGSGTIFFAYCNLLCLFCQNFDISHHGVGRNFSEDSLASVMIAEKISKASDYPEKACRAIKEMHRQVGNLKLDVGK